MTNKYIIEQCDVPYTNRDQFALLNNFEGIFLGQVVRFKDSKHWIGEVGIIGKNGKIFIDPVTKNFRTAWYNASDLEPAFEEECCGLWDWKDGNPTLKEDVLMWSEWLIEKIRIATEPGKPEE